MRGCSIKKPGVWTIAVVLLLISAACRWIQLPVLRKNQGQVQDSSLAVDSDHQAVNGYQLPQYLGYIADPDGYPVPFATVGGTETATLDGVVSGDFEEYQGQWIPVEAVGYAPGFARSLREGPEAHFFSARLTPYQSAAFLEDGESAQLPGEVDEVLSAVVEIQEGTFDLSSAYVAFAVIDRLEVDPRFEETNLDPGLRVLAAFSLQVYDEGWQRVEVEPDLDISLEFEAAEPLSSEAAFAVFDPVEGHWREVDLACLDRGQGAYACQLETMPALLAVFDRPREAVSSEDAFLPASYQLTGTKLSPAGTSQDGVSYGDQAYQEAFDELADYIKRMHDAGTFDPNDPKLKELAEKLEQLALEYLEANPNENGKRTAIKTVDIGFVLGMEGMAVDILEKVKEISLEIGEEALKEEDCGKFRDLLRAAEQIMYFSPDDLAVELIEKAMEMARDCDHWKGRITVRMLMPQEHPAGLPMDVKSGSSWMELHEVDIYTDVDTNQMHGWSSVQHILTPIRFARMTECKQEIYCYGEPRDVRLDFEGFFDGYTFQVNSVTANGKGSSLKQEWDFDTKKGGKCGDFYSDNFGLSPYYSLIYHGVSSASPPINLQEILDSSADAVQDDGIETFRGGQKISNPDPDLGVYPFSWGYIDWFFFHDEKKLPLEEETLNP